MARDFAADIHNKVRQNALAQGEKGRAWLDGLNAQIADIEKRWHIAVGGLAKNATEAFVAEARTREGEQVMLKIVIAGFDPARQELRILRAANGKGYARLLRFDETDNVLLLERLGAQLHELDLPDARQMEIVCATLLEAWMPQPEGAPFATGADKAAEFAGVIVDNWAKSGKPCAQRTVDIALSAAERRKRSFDPALSVLAHGDAHAWNTLAVPGHRALFRLVDPDGAFAERAFDLAVPMREWGSTVPSGDLLALGRQRCAVLSRASGVDPAPIWDWTMLQLLWNGLLLKQIGAENPASVEFAMADAFAAAM